MGNELNPTFKFRATSKEKNKSFTSDPISMNDALNMRDQYLAHDNRLKIKIGNEHKDLKGFRMDVADILHIIEGRPEIHELFIMIGVNTDGSGEQHFTLSFAGINNANAIVTDRVYDFCDPCPDICPTNY